MKGKKPKARQIKLWVVCPSNRSLNPFVSNMLAYNMWTLGVSRIEITSMKTYDEHPRSSARNAAVRDFLRDRKATHLFMYDDDMVLQPLTILRLLNHDKPVISAWYIKRGTGSVIILKRLTKKPFCNIKDFNQYTNISHEEFQKMKVHNNLIKVDACGAGCILIKREVLEKLKPPYFLEWHAGMPKNYKPFGEDIWFCEQLAKNKIPLYVDVTQFIGHITWVRLDERYLKQLMARENLKKKKIISKKQLIKKSKKSVCEDSGEKSTPAFKIAKK